MRKFSPVVKSDSQNSTALRTCASSLDHEGTPVRAIVNDNDFQFQ
jgi:hypothetical protein